MDEPDFLQSAIGKIGEFFLDLKKKMSDSQVRRDTLLDLGLDPNKEAELDIPEDSLSNIEQYRRSVNPDDIAFDSALNDVKILYSSLKDFIKALIDDPKDLDIYIWLFLEMTATNYIRLHYPEYYWWSQLLGFVVESKVTIKSAFEGQGLLEPADNLPDLPHFVLIDTPKFIIKNTLEFVQDPLGYLKNIFKKIASARFDSDRLETIESAENASDFMTAVAVFFHIMQDKMPESRYLYGWSTVPRTFTEENMDELKDSFLGNLLLNSLRKEHEAEFPKDLDKEKSWEKIVEILKKPDLNERAKQITTAYNRTVAQWKRGNWSDLVSERAFSFDLKLPEKEGSGFDKRLGGTMFFVSDEEISDHFNKDSDDNLKSLGGLFISLNGEVNYTYSINDNWELKIKTSSGELLDVYLSSQQDANVLGDMQLEMSLKRKSDPGTGASYALPKKSGTRLAIGEIKISVFLNKEDWGTEIGLKENAVVISGGDGDGFISKILPSGDVPLKFSVAAGLSKKKGFYMDHNIDVLKDVLGSSKDDDKKDKEPTVLPVAKTATAIRPIAEGDTNKEVENKEKEKQAYELLIPIHKDLGLLYFDSVNWDYGPTKKKNALGAYLKVLSTFSTKLGPVMVKVDKTGLGIEVSVPNRDEDLGTTDFSFGFAPPKGVALRIDSEIISGGGFLELDSENNRYAGVLDLKLDLTKLDIQLIAIGLINTRLPNGKKGFSMLISISVLFTPGFQLSFGFTLNGVGGLIGIHRTMKVDVLRERIQSGSMKSVMFPENVIENAAKIISDLRAIFPPQHKHYVVAPFVKIGYSTPTILEVDLGILVEIPFKGRLILLGSLGVFLPNKDVKKRLVELHIDVFGDFNFAESYILIEGRLRDSHIVSIPLSGGFAFMLDWGSNPQFLLSVGGYHPRYKKPERFPAIPRLTALIKKGDNFRMSCEYYQAITSNSFQIGFSAELVYKKGKAKAFGFLGFNALLQFDPFYFETDIRISVDVTYRGRSFFGVDMEFMLSGPEPWRARGYAKIKVLFFSLKIKFNISWGGEQKAVPAFIETAALLEKLQLQLQQPSNWSGKLPERFSKAESLRSLEETEKQDRIFMHPSGYLELRQNLIPLNKVIEKLGNSYVGAKTSYQISEYAFNDGESIDPKTQKPLLGYFSRGQFEDLPDNEKLSTVDFDLMSAGIQVGSDQVVDISPNLQSTANDFEDIILGETETSRPKGIASNWQGKRAMNLSGAGRPIDVTRPEELFGVLETLPDYKEKAYKILSKKALDSPTQLKEHYFNSYSNAKDYLQSNWPKEKQILWQIKQAETQESEKAMIV